MRVGKLCQLDVKDINLLKRQLHIADAKTPAGVRTVDIHPTLHSELTSYYGDQRDLVFNGPAFPSSKGTRRDRSNVLNRVVQPVVARANELRARRGEPPIRAHVTPHTLRRTYITFMVAAGYNLPYVQSQVGHVDPTTTLGIYAQLRRWPDRDRLRAEIRNLLGTGSTASDTAMPASRTAQSQRQARRLTVRRNGRKGRALRL